MKEQWHPGGIKGRKNHGMSSKTLSIHLVQPCLWLFIHCGCCSQDMSSQHGSSLCPLLAPRPLPQLLWPMPTQAAGLAQVQPGISPSTAASLGVTSTTWNGKQGPSIAIQCQHPSFFSALGPRKLDIESKVNWDWCCCDAVKSLVKWRLQLLIPPLSSQARQHHPTAQPVLRVPSSAVQGSAMQGSALGCAAHSATPTCLWATQAGLEQKSQLSAVRFKFWFVENMEKCSV